jgi:hypothetical protein
MDAKGRIVDDEALASADNGSTFTTHATARPISETTRSIATAASRRGQRLGASAIDRGITGVWGGRVRTTMRRP